MSQNNIKLNDIKDFAFLADQSYKTSNGKKGQLPKSKEGVITNDTTNSSFEVVAQVNDDTTGFSGTVFKDPVSGEYTIAFRGTEIGNEKISA